MYQYRVVIKNRKQKPIRFILNRVPSRRLVRDPGGESSPKPNEKLRPDKSFHQVHVRDVHPIVPQI